MKNVVFQWKQYIAMILVVAVAVIGGSSYTADADADADAQTSNQAITVLLNDQQLELEVDPLVKNGTTFVPMRPLFEALGMELTWDPVTKTVKGAKEGLQLSLTIGSKEALVNQAPAKLSEPALVQAGFTFVPLRFISEASDALVLWQPYLKQIYIYDTDFLKENNMTKEELTDNFNKYLEESLAEHQRLVEEQKKKDAEQKDNKDKNKDKSNQKDKGKDSTRDGLCSVWRYHPVYGGSLDWVPCP
ncbi:copper amine oxidase N-terminal domain-containing protein [Paenibacillus senegalimassiliensis]|uniref:copper amine oxidase N-terminal domain-containing protein n=1 Tax=Paenibacillus senegalimassiliensis TaxID=1737426 RepID=UPI00073F3150|nr:copper amine oxidase N-terminal domain-containing protein [Paenibacillus senegalimassiliensis]